MRKLDFSEVDNAAEREREKEKNVPSELRFPIRSVGHSREVERFETENRALPSQRRWGEEQRQEKSLLLP